MRRLRVLTLIDYLIDTGGAERFALGLATHLPADRFEVWACSTRSSEPAAALQLQAAGVRHLSLGRHRTADIRRMGGLLRLMRAHRFDVVHAHMFGSNVWGTVLGRLARVPVVLAHETTWSYEGEPVRRWIDGKVIGRLATRFLAVSQLDAHRMAQLEGVPPDKIVVMPNAYIPRPGSPDSDLRRDLGLGAETPLLAVVAQLRPQKALSVLLDAFPAIRQAVPETHLVIAGDGECRGELEAQAQRLQIADRVHFLGRRDDIDAILRAADLAVMSSDYEGMPLVAYECLANGTPLVATAVGGLPEIIQDGRTGLLVAPRDPAALAEAIAGLLGDPDRRAAMSAAGTARRDELMIGSVAQQFGDLYEALLAQSGAPPPA
jgi:glycosyltransferase involved in cell wall biosynthesis